MTRSISEQLETPEITPSKDQMARSISVKFEAPAMTPSKDKNESKQDEALSEVCLNWLLHKTSYYSAKLFF